jgi:hypothetical protein
MKNYQPSISTTLPSEPPVAGGSSALEVRASGMDRGLDFRVDA